ncbi:MAG: FG-GAP repeat protein [Planctomycetes bacterium]|nr:FG-GAP repeat protein [Planctomycetota bacterium]
MLTPRSLCLLRRTWALALGLALAALAARAIAPFLPRWDLRDTSQRGQLSVYNSTPEGGEYGLPLEIGDLDGDGAPDLVLAPMAATGGGARATSGEVYVYRGNARIEGVLDRSAPETLPPGITIWGARAGDFLGTELFTADVNGDDIEDLLFSSQNYDGPDGLRDSCGGAFILFGRRDLLERSRTIDLAAPPADVVTIVGAEPGDRLGVWIEAGDLDGDRVYDVLIGADQPRPRAERTCTPQHRTGLAVVIYGRSQFPAVLDLAGAAAVPGVSVVRGRDPCDHFGCTLHSRDLNRDGRDELIVSAALNRYSAGQNPGSALNPNPASSGGGDGPDGQRPDCGEVYVIFGPKDGGRLPPVLDLALPLPPALEGRVTTIYGSHALESAGEELTSGDFNGDGYLDLVVGALTGANPFGRVTGTAYVLYWIPGLEGKAIDLEPGARASWPEGLRVSKLYGLGDLDLLGDTLSAGDFDHDGIDDLAVGIPMEDVRYSPQEDPVIDVGTVALAFGRPEPWPEIWAPQSLQVPEGLRLAYVLGPGSMKDLLSYSMEAADYDGDGYADLFPNAMRGDGSDNLHTDAGEAYLVSGYRIAGAPPRLASVRPAMGLTTEETPVAVTGEGFTTAADTRLLAGGAEARSLKVLSSTRLEAVLPARAEPGAVEIRMENRYGAAALAAGFLYVRPDVFTRGDSNLDGLLDISDPIHTLRGLFAGGSIPCMDAGDSNDDGKLDASDAVYSLRYLFLGEPPPPPPYPGAATDPTQDELGCR